MRNKSRILIVEDEHNIMNFISTILTANDYLVLKAKTCQEAMSLSTSHCPDLILLDLGLPDSDGTGFIQWLREWSSIPVIVVSARDRERDKVDALDFGADDYITKPFGTAELLARIRTALRHKQSMLDGSLSHSAVFCAQGLVIDFAKRYIEVNEKEIHLTQIEFKIIELLAKYAGRVLTYDYILKNIWGPNTSCDNQILRVNMANIRRKIEENPAQPKYVFTEVGVGYRMIEADQ